MTRQNSALSQWHQDVRLARLMCEGPVLAAGLYLRQESIMSAGVGTEACSQPLLLRVSAAGCAR